MYNYLSTDDVILIFNAIRQISKILNKAVY